MQRGDAATCRSQRGMEMINRLDALKYTSMETSKCLLNKYAFTPFRVARQVLRQVFRGRDGNILRALRKNHGPLSYVC